MICSGVTRTSPSTSSAADGRSLEFGTDSARVIVFRHPESEHMPLPPLRRAAAPALLAAALLAVPAPAWADPPAEDADFTLTVLHANDLESALLGAPADADYGGAARFTALMERLRAEESGPEAARGGESEHRGAVSLSSGDMYRAGPELSASMEEGAPFYDAIAAARTGWDAISFGNHEFDFGPDFYADYIEAYREAGGTAPFLSANTDVSAEPRLAELAAGGAIAPSTVLEEQGEEIGVVGALTPQLPAISSPRGVVVDPEVAAAVQGAVDDLTDEGVDKIVLISHLQDIGNERALVS